jgi:hypothetical protein
MDELLYQGFKPIPGFTFTIKPVFRAGDCAMVFIFNGYFAAGSA